ncbi:reverse transcriptase domain, reverse transcriptase zinc-binding domain protein [Tanacetum coccineum]
MVVAPPLQIVTSDQDKWEYLIDSSRRFSVKGMIKLIMDPSPLSYRNSTRWNKLVPIKVNIASWRIENLRIPTRVNLDSRGMNLHSTRCSICDDDLETEDHVLVKCGVALNIWRGVLKCNKGLVECKALASNLRRTQVKDIINEVEDYLKTYSLAGMDINDSESFKVGGVLDEINDYLKCLFLLWHIGFQSNIGRANLDSLREWNPIIITSSNLLFFLMIHDSA